MFDAAGIARALATVSALTLAYGIPSNAVSASPITYSVVDLGAPPSSFYASGVSDLIYINNTGQAVGAGSSGCVAYDGGTWIPLQKPHAPGCAPASEGISDADASGTFYVVGQSRLPTVESPSGGPYNMFEAKVGPSGVKSQTLGAYSPSAFYGINPEGLAAASTGYAPMAGWYGGIAALIRRKDGPIALLQPTCALGTASGEPCMGDSIGMQTNFEYHLAGSPRIINKSGTVLGFIAGEASNTGMLVEVNAKRGTSVGFLLPDFGRYYWSTLIAGIDDRGGVVYTRNTGGLYRFDPSTQTNTKIGTAPGCGEQDMAFTNWVNGPGDVLSGNGNCSGSGSTTAFLWTRSAGWSAINLGPAPSGCNQPYIEFLGYGNVAQMNDKDQFALPMMCGSAIHWALLCPPAAPCGGSDSLPVSVPRKPSRTLRAARLPIGTSLFPEPAPPAFSAPLNRLLAGMSQPAPASGAARRLWQQAGMHRPRNPLASEPAYTIEDIGFPPGSIYLPTGDPVALNNTGQIVGEAYPIGGYGHPTCVAWTGGAWVDLHPTDLGASGCTASVGISDAVSGVFAAVGRASYPTITVGSAQIAFYSTIGPSSASTKLFDENSPSYFTDMNESGTAVGSTYYSPNKGWYDSTSPVTSSGGDMKVLQPRCGGGSDTCISAPVSSGPVGSIGFSGTGTRSIDGGGTILGNSDNVGEFVEYGAGSAFAFYLPLQGGSMLGGIPGIDDDGDVIYGQTSSDGTSETAWRYDPSTKTSHTLGKLGGSSCSAFVPLAVNASGEVLGETANCQPPDLVYWVWNATSGMQAIDVEGSPYEQFTAFALNDNGQILIELSARSFDDHWGTLNPASSGSTDRRRHNSSGARTNFRAP